MPDFDPLALPAANCIAADGSQPATSAVAVADWLMLPGESAPIVEPDWLASPDTAPPVVLETQKFAARYDALRFQVMKGTHRVWACDGEYVACRPRDFANETIQNRHRRFLAQGHYEHVGTFDDVQVFKLLPGSPFLRTAVDLRTAGWYECLRGAAIAAVNRDWGLYTDVLEEIATRLKSTPTGTSSGDGGIDIGIAKDRWEFVLTQIGQMVYMRGGPTQAELDAGVSMTRTRRGDGRGRLIAVPASRRIQ